MPVFGTISGITLHVIPTNYPLRKVMLTAQRFDKSGRSRNDYESLTAFIERWARNQMPLCDLRRMRRADAQGISRRRSVAWIIGKYSTSIRQLLFVLPCAENWMAEGDAGLPRITGLKYYHNHDERWSVRASTNCRRSCHQGE